MVKLRVLRILSITLLIIVLASISVVPTLSFAQKTGFVLARRVYTPIYSMDWVYGTYYAMFTSDSRLLFIAVKCPPGWLRYDASNGEGYAVGGDRGAYILDMKFMKLYYVKPGSIVKIKVTDTGLKMEEVGTVPVGDCNAFGTLRYYISRDGYVYIHWKDRLEIRSLNGTLVGTVPYKYTFPNGTSVSITNAYGFAVDDAGDVIAVADGSSVSKVGLMIFKIFSKEPVDYKVIYYDKSVLASRRITISRDGKIILAGSSTGTKGVHMYFVEGDTVVKVYHDVLTVPSGVGALQASYDLSMGKSTYLFVGGFQGEMYVYRLYISPNMTYRLSLLFNYSDPSIGRVYNPYGIQSGFTTDYARRFAGFVGVNYAGYIVDLNTYEYVRLSLPQTQLPPRAWAVSPDGKYIFIGTTLYTVTLNDKEEGKPRMRIIGHVEIPETTLTPNTIILPKIEMKDKTAEWLWTSPSIRVDKIMIEKGVINLVEHPYYLAKEKDLYQGYANIYTEVRESLPPRTTGESVTISSYTVTDKEIAYHVNVTNKFYLSQYPATLYGGTVSFLRAKIVDTRLDEFLSYLDRNETQIQFDMLMKTKISYPAQVSLMEQSISPRPSIVVPIVPIIVALGLTDVALGVSLLLQYGGTYVREARIVIVDAVGFEVIYNGSRYCALILYLPTDTLEEDVEVIKKAVLDYLQSGIRFRGVTLMLRKISISSYDIISRSGITMKMRNEDLANALLQLIGAYNIPMHEAYVVSLDIFPGIVTKVVGKAGITKPEISYNFNIVGSTRISGIAVNKVLKNIVISKPEEIYKYIKDVQFVFSYRTLDGTEDIVVSTPQMVHNEVVIPIPVPPGTVEVKLVDMKVPSEFKFKINGTIRSDYIFKKQLTIPSNANYAYGVFIFDPKKYNFLPVIDGVEFLDLPSDVVMIFVGKKVVNNLMKNLGQNTTLIYISDKIVYAYEDWAKQFLRRLGSNFTLDMLTETFSETNYTLDNKTYYSYVAEPFIVSFIDDVDRRILAKGDTLKFTLYFSSQNDAWISVRFQLKEFENKTVQINNTTYTRIIHYPPTIPQFVQVTVFHNAPIANPVQVNVTVIVNATIQYDPAIIIPSPTPLPQPGNPTKPTPIVNNTTLVSLKIVEYNYSFWVTLEAVKFNETVKSRTETISLEQVNGLVTQWVMNNATKLVRELLKNKTKEVPANITYKISLTYITIAKIVKANVNSISENDNAMDSQHVPFTVVEKLMPLPKKREYNVTVYVYTYVVNNTTIYRKPVPGALVRLLFTNNTLFMSATTDVNGMVKFTKVPNGTYILLVTADGYKEYKKTIIVDTNKVINVELKQLTLPANNTAWVRISAVTLDNQPLRDVDITVYEVVNNTTIPVGHYTTDDDGIVEALVFAGKYYMFVGKYVNNTPPVKYVVVYGNTYNETTKPPIIYVEANKLYSIVMMFNISQRLRPAIGKTLFKVYVYDGRNYTKGLAGATITAVFYDRNGTVVDIVNGTTNASGVFSFTYTIRNGSRYTFYRAEFYATLQGWSQINEPYEIWVTDVYENKTTLIPIAMAPIEVLQANNTTNVTVVVLQRNGAPIQNASVELYVNGVLYASGQTGSKGDVSFIVPVNVTVYAKACYSGVCNTSGNYTTTLQPLTIILTLDIEEITVPTPSNYILLVHTIDAITSDDLPGVTVTIYWAYISNESKIAWSVTNESGYAEFIVAPGYYLVYGNKTGYKSITVDVIVNKDNVTVILPMVPEGAEFITPPPGSNETTPPVIINNTTYWWLHVTVVYQDYIPVEGANVSVAYLWNNTTYNMSLLTGSDGEAWFLIPNGSINVTVNVTYLAFTETRIIPVMNTSYWLIFMVNYTSEYYAPEVGITYASITTSTHIGDFEQLFEAMLWTNTPQNITLLYEVYEVVNNTTGDLLWNVTKTVELREPGWWFDRVWFTLNLTENTTVVGVVRIIDYENDTDPSNNIYITQPIWYRPYIDVAIIAYWKVLDYGNKELAIVPELTTIALVYNISLTVKKYNMTIPVVLVMNYKDYKADKMVDKSRKENITIVNATASRTMTMRVPWASKINGYIVLNITDDNTLNNNASIVFDIPPNIKILEVSAPKIVSEKENFTVKVKIISNTNDTIEVILNTRNGTIGSARRTIKPGIITVEFQATAPEVPPVFWIFKKPSETFELGVGVSNYDVYGADNRRLVQVEVVTNMGWILLILVILALITVIAITVKTLRHRVYAIRRTRRYVVEE